MTTKADDTKKPEEGGADASTQDAKQDVKTDDTGAGAAKPLSAAASADPPQPADPPSPDREGDAGDDAGDDGDSDAAKDDAKAEVAGLKKDLKVERTKATNLEKEKTALSEQLEQLKAQLAARNEADMKDLSDDEKAIVMDFAGGDEAEPQAVFDALTKARKHSLIGGERTRPKANRDRTASGANNDEPPKTWAEADRRSGLRTTR